ncbi:MAG: PEP-CTERM sorting domain-containing protein [Planctomycetota bacterium]|nr:MAG: PEP-CTERM sorting domain-containing protein [Planctomycetota bacterium]
MSTHVPEPGSAVLLTAAVAVMMSRRRRSVS